MDLPRGWRIVWARLGSAGCARPCPCRGSVRCCGFGRSGMRWPLGIETAQFDLEALEPRSRQFAEDLLNRFPQFRSSVVMERQAGTPDWTLLVTVPAPSGDPLSTIEVWADRDDGPGVRFGTWHTHESLCDRGTLFELIEGILVGRFALCEPLGDEAPRSTLLDLADSEALVDELTRHNAPGQVIIRSWAHGVRHVSLDELRWRG